MPAALTIVGLAVRRILSCMSESANVKYKLRPSIYALAALSAFIILSLAAERAGTGTLADWEITIFQSVYNWPDWLRPVFLALTQLGSAWMLIIVPLSALSQGHKVLARRLLASGLTAFLLMEWLKYIVDRPRPVDLLNGYTSKEAFVTGNGFPSGHTTIAVVLALTLWPYLSRKHWYLLAAWIIAVAVSRLYLGVHAPLDILGGLVLGLLVASVGHLWAVRPRLRSKLRLRKKPSL